MAAYQDELFTYITFPDAVDEHQQSSVLEEMRRPTTVLRDHGSVGSPSSDGGIQAFTPMSGYSEAWYNRYNEDESAEMSDARFNASSPYALVCGLQYNPDYTWTSHAAHDRAQDPGNGGRDIAQGQHPSADIGHSQRAAHGNADTAHNQWGARGGAELAQNHRPGRGGTDFTMHNDIDLAQHRHAAFRDHAEDIPIAWLGDNGHIYAIAGAHNDAALEIDNVAASLGLVDGNYEDMDVESVTTDFEAIALPFRNLRHSNPQSDQSSWQDVHLQPNVEVVRLPNGQMVYATPEPRVLLQQQDRQRQWAQRQQGLSALPTHSSPRPARTANRQQPILPHRSSEGSATTRTSINRGGRRSNMASDQRTRISKVRKIGACWRCVMQRDPCRGDGPCCERCIKLELQHSPGMYILPCDRTKLPGLLQDFIPASMMWIHQKQNVVETMRNDAIGGIPEDGPEIVVNLTAGYGPLLSWPMVEFRPTNKDVLVQFQFSQNAATRLMEKKDKYSPPLAIRNLNSREETVEKYLDDILADYKYLDDFASICYTAESRHNQFQAGVLQALCTLHQNTQDPNLHELLKRVLRMLVLTNIMVHTLTIDEDSLDETLGRLRGSVPRKYFGQKHTSPKLGNQQLKFFFSTRREAIYLELLKMGQKMLRSSGDKAATWISMFVVILGFAMVLEESQSILQIQAISKEAKGEMTWKAAQDQAYQACKAIDARFELLVALFQHKYRDDRWTSPGSFGNQTPAMSDGATKVFLHTVRRLLVENEDYLIDRRETGLGNEQQCKYTARLVAKFLLPFLYLPV